MMPNFAGIEKIFAHALFLCVLANSHRENENEKNSFANIEVQLIIGPNDWLFSCSLLFLTRRNAGCAGS